MPPLSADFARSTASRLGISLGDAAAAELAVHLELHLRSVLGLALKLARRARRRRLRCVDIIDASECGGELAPWASTLMQQCAMSVGRSTGKLPPDSVVPLQLESELKLGLTPVELSLAVEWLAVDGLPVSLSSKHDSVASRGDGQSESAGIVLTPAPSYLAEEQVSLLTRIVQVLDGGEDTAKWHEPVLAACRREECRPLLPFLAQYLVSKVPACLTTASPRSLHLLLGVLECVALAPQKAEALLHQCMPTALLLCLSPALGFGRRQHALPGEEDYHGVRRDAAGVVAKIALRYSGSLPEVYAEVYRVYEEALRRSPALSVVAGAALGLAALGPSCATQVLTPALMDGLVEHIAAATAMGQAAVDEGNDEPAAKRPRFILGARQARLEEGRATTFDALVSTAKAAISAKAGSFEHQGPSASAARASFKEAAQLCEAACAAFGTDPAPLLAAIPVQSKLQPSPLQSRGVRRPLNVAARDQEALAELMRVAAGGCRERSTAAPATALLL